jgi:hypothetical protein
VRARRVAVALTTLVTTTVLGATAAHAEISSPADGAIVNEQPTVRGKQPIQGEDVDRVTVTLTPVAGGSPVSVVCAAGCAGADGTFSAAFQLQANGTYKAVAVAEHDDDGPLDSAASSSSAPVTFGVEIPPAAPRRLVAEADGTDRTVTLSWSPNGESDLLGYQVFRGVDGSAPQPHGSPVGAGTTTFVDRVDDGGELTYQVVAIRRGATANRIVASTESNTASASIARVSPPTTTASGGGASSAGTPTGGGGGGGSAPAPGGLRAQPAAEPLRITPGGRVDLSGFTPNTVPFNVGPAPDPGYQETLPYRLQAEATEEVAEPGDEPALPAGSLTTTTSETNRRALLSFLAAAMLLFMLSMHLRWLLRRAAPVTG